MLTNMTQVPRPTGTFHAIATKDAQAQEHDGDAFFQFNELDESLPSPEGRLFEILFGDGDWMLAREVDLEFRGA